MLYLSEVKMDKGLQFAVPSTMLTKALSCKEEAIF